MRYSWKLKTFMCSLTNFFMYFYECFVKIIEQVEEKRKLLKNIFIEIVKIIENVWKKFCLDKWFINFCENIFFFVFLSKKWLMMMRWKFLLEIEKDFMYVRLKFDFETNIFKSRLKLVMTWYSLATSNILSTTLLWMDRKTFFRLGINPQDCKRRKKK